MMDAKKRSITVLVAGICVWTLLIGLATVVFAANPQAFSVGDAKFELTATHSKGTVTITDQGSGTVKIAAKGYKEGTCDNNTADITFTLKNKTVHNDANATCRKVTFTITVTDDDKTASGTTSGTQTLTDGTLTFKAKTGAGSGDTNNITLTISDVSLEPSIVPLATTIKTGIGGTLSVNGTEQTDTQKTYSNVQGTEYRLSATAADGYSFYGWQSSSGQLSTASTYTYNPTSDSTIWPLFVKTGSAMYSVTSSGTNYYGFLDEAATAANPGGTVVVHQSGIVYGSSGTTINIPAAVKLLVPYSAANATAGGNFDEKPDMTTTSYYNTQSTNIQLTVPTGTIINCAGKICVDGQVFADTLYSGCPAGPHGRIVLESGSALNMKSGSTLYAWGYITGVASNGSYSTGTVTAESGSTIYESFQALGWRGGNLMKKWMNSSSSRGFAFADYALQNIEANLQINNEATLKFTTSLEGSGTNAQVAGTFVSNSSGFLQMGTNGSVLRTYDPYNNRIRYDLYGTMNVANIKMTLASLGSVDSQEYILGLNHSMDIVINSKANITMLYDYKIMPGASVTIIEGGKATVNGDVYIYDTADYVIDGLTYAHHQSYTWLKSVPVSYIAATGYKSDGFNKKWEGISMISASTPSGKVVVNGELLIASTGGIYTSSNGGQTANKVITGTGTIINNSKAASIVTDQLDEAKTIYNNALSQSVEDHNKTVTPAVGLIKGLSANASDYRCFEAGKTYYGNSDGYWYEYTVSTITNGGESQLVAQVGNGSTISFNSSNVASSLSAANAVYTFTADGYNVETSNGTLTEENGVYSITNITEDITITLTSSCTHSDVTATTEVSATCEQSGTKAYWTCECGKIFSDAECTTEIANLEAWLTDETENGGKLTALGHSYGTPTFSWAEDNKCYATYVCAGCGKKVENAECTVTFVTEDATCTAPGKTVYSASIKIDEQTYSAPNHTEEIPALGHQVSGEANAVTFEWNGYTSCTANDDCTTCKETIYPECSVTSSETQKVSCTQDGVTTYTASVTVNEATYQDVKEKTEPKIDHKFTTYKPHTDATCKEFATEIASCDYGCGTTNTRTYGEKLNHNYGDYVNNGNATCTENGTQTRTCSVCGDKQTVEVENSKLGHDCTYTPNNDATCTVDGTKTGECSRCDYSETVTDTGSAKGHSFTNYVDNGDAKCGVDGTKTAICDNGCGEKDTITAEGTALKHQFGEYVSDGNATCISDGTKTRVCTECGDKETVADTGSKLGHSFTKYEYQNDATCTKNGTETAKCDRCDVTDTREKAESKLPHSYGDYVSNNNASCTANATQTRKCENCDATDTVDIPGTKLDHVFTNYVSNNNATCQADGTKTASCDNGCGTTNTIADEGTQKPHTEVIDAAVAPTCTTTGLSEGKHCSVCGTVTVAQTVVAANGHKDEVVTVDPTCTADGSKTFTCTVCGDTRTEAIPATGHTAVTDDAVAPTCTETGLTAGSHCSVCNTVLVAQEEVAALGHKEVVDEAVAPTCSATGLTEGSHCSVCDTVLVKQETVAKLPHTPGETAIENKTDATCTNPGSYDEVVYCTGCETEVSRNTVTVPQNGHNYGSWTQTSAPTCSATGVKTRTCSVCGHVETDTIPKTEHTAGNAVVENIIAPTANALGSFDSVVRCGNCGELISSESKTLYTKLAAIEASADSEILLRLKCFVPAELVEQGAYAEVTKVTLWDNKAQETETEKIVLSELTTDNGGRYVLSKGMASGEMTCPMTVRFFDGNGNALNVLDYADNTVSDSVTRTVLDYAKRILEVSTNEQQRAVTSAMVTYGGYAQLNFEVDSQNPVYSILGDEAPSLSSVTITDTYTDSGDDIGISLDGRQAYLDSAIYLRSYFKLTGNSTVDDYTFTLTYTENGTEKTKALQPVPEMKTKSGVTYERYYVDILDIPAAYLDYMYKITVTHNETGKTYELNTSVNAYLKDLIANSTKTEQINSAKAMYLYNQAANNFFGK